MSMTAFLANFKSMGNSAGAFLLIEIFCVLLRRLKQSQASKGFWAWLYLCISRIGETALKQSAVQPASISSHPVVTVSIPYLVRYSTIEYSAQCLLSVQITGIIPNRNFSF